MDGDEVFIAHAQVEGEVRGDFPIILHETSDGVVADVDVGCGRAAGGGGGVTQSQIGRGVVCRQVLGGANNPGKGKHTGSVGDVEVGVASLQKIDADLDVVRAVRPADVINNVEVVIPAVLGQIGVGVNRSVPGDGGRRRSA